MHRLSVPAAFLAAMCVSQVGHAAEPVPASPNAAAPAAIARSSTPAKPKLDLSVYPESIDLSTARDYQSFIAVVHRDDDVTLDVTDKASWKLADDQLARILLVRAKRS